MMKRTLKILGVLSFVIIFGCAEPADTPSGDHEGSIFPHPAGWAAFTYHGAYVEGHGLENCSNSCHGEDYHGGSAIACYFCHGDYPHTEGWSNTHKATLIERGNTSSCATNCHNENLSDCTTCHSQYPHASGWMGVHPEVAVSLAEAVDAPLFDIISGEVALESCTMRCHNRPDSLGSTCGNCHSSNVHSQENWGEGEVHGPVALGEEGAGCTTSCHRDGGIAPSCNSCHQFYPHPDNFDSGSGENSHPVAVRAEGFDYCTRCHGDFDGGASGVSCGGGECHGPQEFPHSDGDWENEGADRHEHGEYFMSERLAGEERPCLGCHESDYENEEGVLLDTCTSCHRYFPHPEGFETSVGEVSHPAVVRLNGFDYCTDCHGENYDGGDSGVSCGGDECHGPQEFPHLNEDWEEGDRHEHGNFYLTEWRGGDETPCLGCHTSGYEEEEGVSLDTCVGCHDYFPHPENFESGSGEAGHPVYVQRDGFGSCKNCHGEFDGGRSGVSCGTEGCHQPQNFPHLDANWEDEDADLHEHGAFYLTGWRGGEETPCLGCHSGTYPDDGLVDLDTCNSCHEIFPHAENVRDASGEGSHVFLVQVNGFSACVSCHGEHFDGGDSGETCAGAECHDPQRFPHLDANWEDEDADLHEHGTYYLTQWRGDVASPCLACHTDTYSTDERIETCNECHPTFPHAENIRGADGDEEGSHVRLVKRFGFNACKTCHGDDFNGGITGLSCSGADCHTPHNFPHLNDNWENEETGEHEHGVTYAREIAGGEESPCIGCHESIYKLEAGVLLDTCVNCHEIYPHPENFEEESGDGSHPEYIQEHGFGSCKTSCHGLDYNGGNSGVSCAGTDCHQNFPHMDENWENEAAGQHQHGLTYEEQRTAGEETPCLECHTGRYSGDSLIDTCDSSGCHPLFPHPEGFEEGTGGGSHGEAIQEYGFGSCKTSCHGTDYNGGNSGRSCAGEDCHTNFPHLSAGWLDLAEHGTPYVDGITAGDERPCLDCHTPRFTAWGDELISNCNDADCHSDYPHLAGWVEEDAAGDHGPEAYGDDKYSCATEYCHGVDFRGGPHGDNCFDCHPDFPHPEAEPNPWMTLGNPSSHWEIFIDRMLAGDENACKECHGSSYTRYMGDVSCVSADCHGVVTHRVRSGSRWNEPNRHGRYYRTNYDSQSADADCWLCHGNAVGFNDSRNHAGLASEADCYGCHWGYPHISYTSSLLDPPVTAFWDSDDDPAGESGHSLYLELSPNLSTGFGIPRPATETNTWKRNAVEATCGRTAYCHHDGRVPPGSEAPLENRTRILCEECH